MTAPTSPLRLRASLLLIRFNWRAASLALAVCAAALVWFWLLPQARQRAAHAAQQAAMQSVPDVSMSPRVPALTADDALQHFESRLAKDEDLGRLMRALWRYAQAGGVQLSKVDYRNEDMPGFRYRRVTLTVPMNGAYPMVRQVIFSLMAEYPGLALTRLDMKREQTMQPQVEATAHLVLYLKP